MQKTTPTGHEQRRYSRFTFVENTIRNLPKVPRTKFVLAFPNLGETEGF